MKSVFKIRDEATGLFSSGGYHPHWDTEGKSWDSLLRVSVHLKLYCRGQYPGEAKTIPESWEVVEFKLTEAKSKRARGLIAAGGSSEHGG